MSTITKQPRSAITKSTAKQVIVYFPKDVVAKIDAMARTNDSDRSKMIRKAVAAFISRSAS